MAEHGSPIDPQEARNALEQVDAMRRASVRGAMIAPPLLLALAAVLAAAYCIVPPLLGDPDGLSLLLFLLMWFAPALGYWHMRARPHIGKSDAGAVAIGIFLAVIMITIQELGGHGYQQGRLWAPFAAGGAAALVFLVAYRRMAAHTRDAVVEQDRERLERGGRDEPSAWYVPMAFGCAALAPGAWGNDVPIFYAVILLAIVLASGLRFGMPGWPRRPMLEEWAALLLYIAVNLGVWMLARSGNVPAAGAWPLSAIPSLTIVLLCYAFAHVRVIDAMDADD